MENSTKDGFSVALSAIQLIALMKDRGMVYLQISAKVPTQNYAGILIHETDKYEPLFIDENAEENDDGSVEEDESDDDSKYLFEIGLIPRETSNGISKISALISFVKLVDKLYEVIVQKSDKFKSTEDETEQINQ